jgi:hypothetical protein
VSERGVGRERLFRGGLGTGTRTLTRTAAICKSQEGRTGQDQTRIMYK